MEEKRLIDADDLLIAFGNALNNATLKISTMWSGSRDTSYPGGCASSSGAQHRQTHRRTSSGASSPS